MAACEKFVEAKGIDEITQSKKGRMPRRTLSECIWGMNHGLAFPLKKAKERIWKGYCYRSQSKRYLRRAAQSVKYLRG